MNQQDNGSVNNTSRAHNFFIWSILVSILVVVGDIIGLIFVSSLADNVKNTDWLFVWLVIDVLVVWTLVKHLRLTKILLSLQSILLILFMFVSLVWTGFSILTTTCLFFIVCKGFTYTVINNPTPRGSQLP